MQKIYFKRKNNHSTDYGLQNEDGTGLSWTVWSAPNQIYISTCFVPLENSERIDDKEFNEAIELAISLIKLPVYA